MVQRLRTTTLTPPIFETLSIFDQLEQTSFKRILDLQPKTRATIVALLCQHSTSGHSLSHTQHSTTPLRCFIQTDESKDPSRKIENTHSFGPTTKAPPNLSHVTGLDICPLHLHFFFKWLPELQVCTICDKPKASLTSGGNFKSWTPTPPERGSFPLDHYGDCKDQMMEYLKCMKFTENKNAPNCRILAKKYLQCRMDNQLMEKSDWDSLGLVNLPGEGSTESKSADLKTDSKSPPKDNSPSSL